ncbi:PTS sugar transporter subunit IIB, partial [Gemmiger sp.]
MKVLLCCAGGLSSSILMRKMKTWADANGEDLDIIAVGTSEAVEIWQDGYECVLLAPQVSYRLAEMQKEIKIPVGEVPSLDYAIGNAENVIKL